MRSWLAELIALPILPFLIAQGRRTRRVTPRLPEAAGPVEGYIGDRNDKTPLTLLTLGESPVAGVGVCTHEAAITGQLARRIASQSGRGVEWRAYGKNGVTVREALEQLIPNIPRKPVDIALVAFGVNDTTAFRPVHVWRRDLQDILSALEAVSNPRNIILSGVPPMAQFPALPQPLRWVMGLKAQALDRAARQLAATRARTVHVPLVLDTSDVSMMASDGYHPSEKGCEAWAQLLADAYMGAIRRQ